MQLYISLMTKVFLICALLLASSSVASAYTIVLRNGNRVEVPNEFRVTETTLTYEIAPRIYRTILLNSVDIPATERANNEASGSLLHKSLVSSQKTDAAQTSSRAAPPSTARITARRNPTLTNRDLESLRIRAQASGRAYELQRRGLPAESRAAADKRAAAELRFMREVEAQLDEEKAEAEIFWRTRAAGLREEFAGLDAELNYWRTLLAEASTSSLNSLATHATTLIGIPHIATPNNFGGVIVGSRPFGRSNVNNFSTVISTSGSTFGAQLGARFNLGGRARLNVGSPRAAVRLNSGYLRRDVRGVRASHRSSTIFNNNTFGYVAPFGGYLYQTYGGYEIGNMRERIRELEAARQRLVARHRLLEEEARRAGASPGWLRR